MSYPVYNEYREVNSIWVDCVPSSWEFMELKRCSGVKGGYAFNSDSFAESGTAIIRIGDIKTDGSVSLEACKYFDDSDSVKYREYEVKSGDLLMAMTGATIGKAGWYQGDEKAFLNQRVGAFFFNSEKVIKRFFWYILNSEGYQKYIRLTAFGGAQPNISDSGMIGYYSSLPTLEEQTQIANFLDRETAKIDTLIEKQQQLIKLLQEKRQAVISHAVTKGLNPNAKMKDSGVEWLSEVPEHWKVLKGAWLGVLFGSESIPEEAISVEGAIPFIKVSTLAVDGFSLGEKKFFLRGNGYKTRKNYIAFPKRGAAIFTNKVNFVQEQSVIDPNLMGWSINSQAEPEYIAYLLKMRGLEDIADVSSVPQINNKHISPIKFCIPPIEEQLEVLKYLEIKVGKINHLIDRSNRAIDLIQEKRTALISAAVTGKIDVRKLA